MLEVEAYALPNKEKEGKKVTWSEKSDHLIQGY